MSNSVICMNAVLPIFIILLVGYACRFVGLVTEQDVRKINKIAFTVFMPVMLFKNIYKSDLSTAVKPRLIVFSVVCVLIAFALSILYALFFVRDKGKQGVMIQGIFRSNFVIIGLPIAKSLIACSDLSSVAVLIAIVVPVFNVLAVICLEVFNPKHAEGIKPGRVAADILKNPLIISSAAGILFLVLGIKLPEPIEKAADEMAGVAGPLLIFLLGAFFRFDRLKENGRYLAAACIGRLVVVPGLFLPAAYKMGFTGLDMAALLGVFAAPTAVNSFVMAEQMGGDAELAGEIVVLTSLLCSFTLFLWSLLFKTLGVM